MQILLFKNLFIVIKMVDLQRCRRNTDVAAFSSVPYCCLHDVHTTILITLYLAAAIANTPSFVSFESGSTFKSNTYPGSSNFLEFVTMLVLLFIFSLVASIISVVSQRRTVASTLPPPVRIPLLLGRGQMDRMMSV